MQSRFILAVLFISFCSFASSASAWVDRVVEKTEDAVNSHCVNPDFRNDTVHILNVPSDQSVMSTTDARTAVLDLTEALTTNGRFRVTRGGALPYEANIQPATVEASRRLAATLDGLSQAAVTIFFFPYDRRQDLVRVEVTLLVRSMENGVRSLTCTPSFRVDIPVSGPGTVSPVIAPDVPIHPHADVISFVKAFHNMANRPGACIDLGRFYAPSVLIDGRTRTRSEQVRLRCEIENRNPEILLHEDTVQVTGLGSGRYRVSYSNTSKLDDQGRRVTTDWFVDALVEVQNGRLQYTRIDLTSRRR
ncbi:MAG TPA: hypothetical protein DIU07_17860 [Rhodobacteraceae bacterium]|nr:hypothetical protein [Paracoccaceae bacterium]